MQSPREPISGLSDFKEGPATQPHEPMAPATGETAALAFYPLCERTSVAAASCRKLRTIPSPPLCASNVQSSKSPMSRDPRNTLPSATSLPSKIQHSTSNISSLHPCSDDPSPTSRGVRKVSRPRHCLLFGTGRPRRAVSAFYPVFVHQLAVLTSPRSVHEIWLRGFPEPLARQDHSPSLPSPGWFASTGQAACTLRAGSMEYPYGRAFPSRVGFRWWFLHFHVLVFPQGT